MHCHAHIDLSLALTLMPCFGEATPSVGLSPPVAVDDGASSFCFFVRSLETLLMDSIQLRRSSSVSVQNVRSMKVDHWRTLYEKGGEC